MFRPRKVFSGARQTELRARYHTMPGLESSCWHSIRFRKELVGKKMFRPRKVFSGAGQTELRARYPIMPGLESSFRRGFKVPKEAGGRKNFVGPDIFFKI